MAGTIRDYGELLAYLGHIGETGRRPRMLVGSIVGVGPADPVTGGPTTAHASLGPGTEPMKNLKVDGGYGGGRLPELGERVKIEAVQYDHVITGVYPK